MKFFHTLPQRHLIVCDRPLPGSIKYAANIEVLTRAEFVSRVRNGSWFRNICAYQDVGMVVPHTWLHSKVLPMIVVLRLLSYGSCWLLDGEGNKTEISSRLILRQALVTLVEMVKIPFLLWNIRKEVSSLLVWTRGHESVQLQKSGQPIYLRTDLWFTSQVGGSVTHMAGVINNFQEFLGRPLVFSTAPNPLLSTDIVWKQILPEPNYWNFREIPELAFSRQASRDIRTKLGETIPAFIYQRYSLNSYAAVLLARSLSAPLVTEYNGSEVWISKNWGNSPVRYDLSSKIEALNLFASDLVVVVSDALKDELLGRGIAEQRILVNPNGVDVEFFNPNIDSNELRESLSITGKTVIGFIGTFGPWHGAEILVQAFAILLKANPEYRNCCHLLMVGDGARYTAAVELAFQNGISENCTFTGLVPQRKGPEYLACCDILAAPHIPNADGSEFFGSPTKLFEYMSMGRPIVASRLGQIGEVIEHGRTGWLVEAGNPIAFAEGLSVIIADSTVGVFLGKSARDEAVQKYSWRRHVERISLALRANSKGGCVSSFMAT